MDWILTLSLMLGGLAALLLPAGRQLRPALLPVVVYYMTVAAADDWLDDLRGYLQGSRDYVAEFVKQRLPGIRVSAPEATYLMWLDCRDLGLSDVELKRFFVQQAGVGMNPGISFGEPGSGFMRLNIGCPRSVLTEVLERIEAALAARR